MTQTLPHQTASLSDRTAGAVLLRNISWSTYTTLLSEVGDDAIRLTYDRGFLEITVPSRRHEQIKRFVGVLVERLMERRGIQFEPAGSATWRREDQFRGLEADECYHIQHVADVQGRSELDLSKDPPPDLAIEVDLTSSSINKMDIYSSLRIPELWWIDSSGQCQMNRLDAGGSYVAIDRSICLPELTPQIVSQYVALREQLGHSEAIARFDSEYLGVRS